MDKGLIMVAELDIRDQDVNRRVYSPDGVAPTIRTTGGGNHTPKVLIKGGPREGTASSGGPSSPIIARRDPTTPTSSMGGGSMPYDNHPGRTFPAAPGGRSQGE